MVDLSKQPVQVISLQAGPGEAGSHVTSVRLHESAVRALGQRLASIGDRQHQEWTRKQTVRQPALHLLVGPAQAFTRAILRDINSQVWELVSLSATAKACFLSTMTEQRGFHLQNWTHFLPAMRPSGTTTGAVAAAALVALCFTLRIEWKP